MECVQCGAELRPNARFCNVCGAEQPRGDSGATQPTAAQATPVETTEAAEVTAAAESMPASATGTDITDEQADEQSDASDGAPDGSGKHKRPPRIPRHRDDEDDTIADAETAESPAVLSPAAPVAVQEDAGATFPETPNAIPLPDMPTMEQPAVITAVPKAEPLDAPLPPYDLDESPDVSDQPTVLTPNDGMPWPLPPAMIIGGRYRIEELVRLSQTEHGPENVYRAHDLQGYEKCWSCGKEHDIATALDPYCDQCGADMLARDFMVVERLAGDAEPALAAQDGTSAATDAEARTFTQGKRSYSVAPKAISAIHFPTGVRVSGYVTADDGRTRQGELNEDSTALLAFDAIYGSRHAPRVLGIVADGLGGHDSGQDASKLVVQTLIDVLAPALIPASSPTADAEQQGDEQPPEFDGEKLLRDAARAANVALCDANEKRHEDMGSTLVAALIVGEMAWIANMGDSRGYVFDDHGLRRVTKDHSLVEQLIDAGMIAPEERYEHPQRNQILKSLGADPRLEADIFPQELRPGTRIMLCSDGVWEMVRDDELARILRETSSSAEASERIVRAANENGGEDNISIVLLDVSA